MNKINFNKVESYFFLLVCLLNLIPVIQNEVFASMDGGAHLYNSTLINSLLFSNNNLISSYFTFNPEPVPNYVGHIILSFFNLFLPAYYAEKILILCYLIGMPFAFRALIKTINSKNILLSYFVFPFTYTSVFLLGFYNYSLAIVFMLIALRYWILNNNFLTLKNAIILFLFISLTYFSHIFLFVILLIALSEHLLINSILDFVNVESKKGIFFKNTVKKIGVLFLISLIPFACFLYYFLSRKAIYNNVYLDFRTLLDELISIRTIIGYNAPIEEVFTKKIFYVILLLFVISIHNNITNFIYKIKINYKEIYRPIYRNIFWAILTITMIFLYFTMPDSDGSGGFISVRIALFIFLFLILWLAAQQIQKWLLTLSVIIVLFYSYQLTHYYTNALKDSNKIVESCYDVATHIPENSLILPLDYSGNWLAGHFSNYLAAEKPMVILENYESDKGYFPLLWNTNNMPNALLKDLETNQVPCLYWRNNAANTKKIIDYVFVLGNLDNITEGCNLEAKNAILQRYTLDYKNNHCELYKLIP